MAHFLAGVGVEENVDFCVHRKTFHKPDGLTGTFYHVNPFTHLERIKKALKTQDRHGWAAKSGCPWSCSPSPQLSSCPQQLLTPHSLPLGASPDPVEREPRQTHLSESWLGITKEMSFHSTLEMSFRVASPSNRDFSPILRKMSVDGSCLLTLPG